MKCGIGVKYTLEIVGKIYFGLIPTGINIKPNECNSCSHDICTYSTVKAVPVTVTTILYYNSTHTHTHTHTLIGFHFTTFLKPDQIGSELQTGKHLSQHTAAKAATL